MASLHFSGHTFDISSSLNVARNVDGNCINFLTKRIHRLPALASNRVQVAKHAADLGHIFVMLTFSSKCESVESRSDLALSNKMIGFLLLLFRKPISI